MASIVEYDCYTFFSRYPEPGKQGRVQLVEVGLFRRTGVVTSDHPKEEKTYPKHQWVAFLRR